MISEYRILYVEDDTSLRDVITELLRGEGHDCTAAADGIEAIAYLESEKFDLLISDIRIPRWMEPNYSSGAGRTASTFRLFL